MVALAGDNNTRLARAIPSNLSLITTDATLDVTRIFSVADQLLPDVPLIRTRHFRAPNHTISNNRLVGGSNLIFLGVIS